MKLLGYDECLKLQRDGKIVMLKKSERKLIFYNFEIIIKLLFDANTSSTMKKMVVNKIKMKLIKKIKIILLIGKISLLHISH